MDRFLIIKSEQTYVVTETISLTYLEIQENAVITAPEGKMLTLTCGGVQMNIAPGIYQGTLILTVTDDIAVKYRDLHHRLQAGVYVHNGKYLEKQSVSACVLGGRVDDSQANDISITAIGNLFNGIYIDGESEYKINNAKVLCIGTGGNDFCGYGAAVCARDNSKLKLADSDIRVIGAARNAVNAGGHSIVEVDNCTISGIDGPLPPDYEDNVRLGEMKAVPWMLGLRGSCRTTNLCQYGRITYRNCKISSTGWGIMSTDDVDDASLQIINSVVENTGYSGYGIYSIGKLEILLDGSVIRVPDFGLIGGSPQASLIIQNGSLVEAGKKALQIGSLKQLFITDSTLRGKEAAICVRSGAAVINMHGGSLESEDGILLETVMGDDPGMCDAWYIDPHGTEERDPGLDVTSYDPDNDTLANLSHMELVGNIYNGTTNLLGDTGPKPEFMPPPPPAEGEDGEAPDFEAFMKMRNGARNLVLNFADVRLTGIISAVITRHYVDKIVKENCRELLHLHHIPCAALNNGVIVNLDAYSRWTVTGTSYLTKLTLEDGAVIQGAGGHPVELFVNGHRTDIQPGTFTGAITLQLA